jgi:membrane AbrB-like protein
VSVAVGILLARFARLDGRTAILGTLPGAASGMLAMSDSLGADPRLVALMQYTRVIVVVLSAALVSHFWLGPEAAPYPSPDQGLQAAASQESTALVPEGWLTYVLTALTAAFGAWIGTRLRLPAGTMLGPLMLGIGLEELGTLQLSWPPGVPQAGYLILGVYVGLLFDRASFQRAGRLLPYVLMSAVGLVATCAGLGRMLSAQAPIDGLTAYLATSPGGMDSVAVMALGSGADVALVLAMQFLRLLAVVLAGGLLGRWWSS